MHRELRALLETARFSLADDMPRLVVADWLEENGNGSECIRADYIRASLTAERFLSDDPQRIEAAARVRELQDAHRPEWFQPLLDLPGVTQLQYDRGMLCPHLNPMALDHLDELFQHPLAPWIEGIRCWGWTRETHARLFDSPHLNRLASLGLGDCEEEDYIDLFLNAPHLSQLRHFLVISGHLSNGGLAAISRSKRLEQATRLCLLGNSLGLVGVRSLVETGIVDRMTYLDLSQNQISIQAIQQLVRRASPSGLRILELGWNRLRARGVIALTAAPWLGSLERIELASNLIEPAGVCALAEVTTLTNLGSLDLGFNQIGNEGARALARSVLGRSLVTLNLRYNHISEAGIRALLESPNLGRLRRLGLVGNEVSTSLTEALRTRFGEGVEI